jgi:hypothetical protein
MFVWKSTYDRMVEWANRNQDAYIKCSFDMMDLVQKQATLREALEEIIANETTRSNATVKRMVRIAQDALDQLQETNKE